MERYKIAEFSPYAREPVLRRMKDGSLVCLFLTGGPKEPDNDNVVKITRSEDEGKLGQILLSASKEKKFNYLEDNNMAKGFEADDEEKDGKGDNDRLPFVMIPEILPEAHRLHFDFPILNGENTGPCSHL